MKHNRIIILAATAMAFAGCSSTDDLEGQSGKELKFTSDISAITPVKMETRASVLATSPDIEAMTLAEKDTILPENQILTRTDSWSARSTSDVAVQIGGGNVYKYAVDNNGVLSSSSTYYFTSLSDQTVAAWFPYSAAFSQFSVKGDQRTLANYNASDLLYATCTVNQNSTGNDLTFAHKTAKIIVNVTVENANYLLNSTINSVTLSGVNLTGSFSNGTLTATNTTGTVQMYNSSASTVTGTTAAATFEACVAPKSSTGDITVTVNVGGTNYTGTLSGGKNLRAGYGHNISVIIKETNVIIFSGTTINVGDYYCNSISGRAYVVKKGDLTRAKSQGITPIAVIFSTSTSSIDQGHGWNNGYAMALKDANQNTLWSTISGRCIQYVQHTTLTEGQDFQEGYTETHYITDNSNYNENNCPAFFHAINYEASTPSPWLSSHWYLPSIGQWNTILRVLGKPSTSVIQQGVSGNTWENMAATVGTHLNEYLSPVGNGNYTPFASDGQTATWYYSSSEYDATHQLNIALWNDNRVYLFDGIDGTPARSKLSSPPTFVRSVIAF